MSISPSPTPTALFTSSRLSGLDCKDLHGYLKTLSPTVLDKLYCHPATCLAVFRQLPSLARHYVIRLLYIEQPVPPSIISSWVTSKHQEDHKQAVKVLTDLRIWYEHRTHGSLQGWMMNQTFREKFKIVMFGGGEPWAKVAETNTDKHNKDIPFLDQYARERWECILHFMVGSKASNEGVSRDVVEILLHAGLMKSDTVGEPPMITTAGFQFLLMDTASQIWFFMIQYLETAEKRDINLEEALSFLFQLSFSTLGKDYSTDGLTKGQLDLLQHLREFGLVYQRKRKSQRYYPTRLAIELASGLQSRNQTSTGTSTGTSNSTSAVSSTGDTGYIVVETNYRVYAYTCSELQVALLALFCDMIYRFANLCVGNISRDSVRQALYMGITASQIINFLRSNAHPESLKNLPALPPTVTDQIRLWELERDRFVFNEGVLYNQFLSASDFELLRDYAKDLDCLVYENPEKRVMVVAKKGHDDVKRFWKRQKRS